MPDSPSTFFTLPADGSRVVIPIPADAPSLGGRIEIVGFVRCLYNNQMYDAVNQFDPSSGSGPIRIRSYLSWYPRTPVLEESDPMAHRYAFRIPTLAAGVLPTVRLDVDRFVNEFLIPPSEVRRSLVGQFKVTVHPATAAAPSAWPVALAAVPTLALFGGVAWVIRRRMTNVVLDFDLEAQIARIHLKAEAARRALGRQDSRLVPAHARMKALTAGADKLARQIQQVRGACALHSRFALEKEIAELELRSRADSPQDDTLLTITDKKKALASLTELDAIEAQFAARLDRAEAVLESALAGLHAVKAGGMAAPVSDNLCRSLDSEVSALREATRPLAENILLSRVGRI